MPQYHHKAWHHLIGAAAAVLLLAVATAVPFGASARDAGGSSDKVGAGTIRDGARKVEPAERAKPVGPIRSRTGEPSKRTIPAGPIRKPTAPGDAPHPVRADDPKKKGGKCTPQQCQALKDACINAKKDKSFCGPHGTHGLDDGKCIPTSSDKDECASISCEGAC